MSRALTPRFAEAREGDIVHSALSPAKLENALGWHAGTSLTDGLAATWEWFEKAQ